jgi:hypothetical protein
LIIVSCFLSKLTPFLASLGRWHNFLSRYYGEKYGTLYGARDSAVDFLEQTITMPTRYLHTIIFTASDFSLTDRYEWDSMIIFLYCDVHQDYSGTKQLRKDIAAFMVPNVLNAFFNTDITDKYATATRQQLESELFVTKILVRTLMSEDQEGRLWMSLKTKYFEGGRMDVGVFCRELLKNGKWED